MCGILGIIGEQGRRPRACGSALDLLAHRGPDDRGEWNDRLCWLGHRRLSIIDLSPGGHQPMRHPGTGAVISFNGEIYNYVELRDELRALGHVFGSQSDTEVLLAAYVQWGTECLSRLNGMWSFVLWDPRDGTAFFSRDRLGVKPLYYTVQDGTLAIASEPKALLALYPGLRRVDDATLYDFLAEGKLYASSASFYAGISSLLPAHLGVFRPGDEAPAIRRYWTLPGEEKEPRPYEESLERFGALLEDATRLRMRSDVPVGVTLSGGLDSTAVLHGATKSAPSVRAFTSIYSQSENGDRVDERAWARLVAGRHSTVTLEEVEARRGEWLETLPRIVWHMDGPGYSPAVFPLWGIMARARASGVPVLLEGQGADELIGGYPQYAAVAMRAQTRHLWRNPLAAWKEYVGYANTFTGRVVALWMMRQWVPGLRGIYRRQVGLLGSLHEDFARAHASRANHEQQPSDLAEWLATDLTRNILPGLLQYGDSISMAHSIESRLPFLDYRLVEFVAALPSEYRVGCGESKRILRDYLRRCGLAEVGNRKDKQGYPTPAYDWMAIDRGTTLRDVLLAPGSRISTYCDAKRLEALITRFADGRTESGNHLYRLLSTELWLRDCISSRQEAGTARPPATERTV
jgi:asparagine synthase (glutamine-hydrolysing)